MFFNIKLFQLVNQSWERGQVPLIIHGESDPAVIKYSSGH